MIAGVVNMMAQESTLPIGSAVASVGLMIVICGTCSDFELGGVAGIDDA